MTKVVATVTGPSASGKTELVAELCKSHNFEKLVSVTTRPMRDGEVEGRDYYFITEEEFFKLKNAGKLVQEVCFNGKYYATTSMEIERVFAIGKVPIVIVEPGGVEQFMNVGDALDFNNQPFSVYSIFIHAPYEVLEARFVARLKTSELTEYDKVRLEAVKKEASDWLGLRYWDLVLGNPINDLSLIQWLARQVDERINGIKEE